MEKLIKKYVDKLTIADVKKFGNENQVFLDDEEAKIIFTTIKEKWSTILYGNTDQILEEIRQSVKVNNFNKVKELLFFYKEKYKDYL